MNRSDEANTNVMNGLTPTGKQRPNCELVGQDGNAFAIMGRVSRALKKNGFSEAEVSMYLSEATSGDYNNLLRVNMDWVCDQ
jgi:hypothetical protein